MSAQTNVCLLGQFLVDVTLPLGESPYKLRAGGIMHAARALWALDCRYSFGYCGPDYLATQVADHAQNYAAAQFSRFGVVTGCPNVLLVSSPKEAGPQGYEFLLRDSQKCVVDSDAIRRLLKAEEYSDIIVFPGGFDLEVCLPLVGETGARIYIDANFEPSSSEVFQRLGRTCECIILSTSSDAFQKRYRGSVQEMSSDLLGRYARNVLLKENRGGSRLFTHGDEGNCIRTPAQVTTVQHSVGVGDCFDAVFVVMRRSVADQAALAYASCLAAEYASTTYPESFRDAAKGWMDVPANEIEQLSGSLISWEERRQVQVYVAGPDFDHVDRIPIDAVARCLEYHNFVPRLPVREHGQMGLDATRKRKQELCEADLRLLGECQMVVAVLPYDDPGTLIEIGIAVERGLSVIVYDPHNRAENLMLTQLPILVSSDLDAVISSVFKQASIIVRK